LAGAALPFLTIILATPGWRLPLTIVASIVALAATGTAGAYLGGSSIWKSVVRIVIGGSAALAVTFAIGSLFNTSVG
jgi:VIT1/CCC1 family predicted Fe2+/Mn2+ transporter